MSTQLFIMMEGKIGEFTHEQLETAYVEFMNAIYAAGKPLYPIDAFFGGVEWLMRQLPPTPGISVPGACDARTARSDSHDDCTDEVQGKGSEG